MGFYAGPICISPDVVLQISGDHFFIRECKDIIYKPNQYIGDECLMMFKMAGMKVKIINWHGRTIQTINY